MGASTAGDIWGINNVVEPEWVTQFESPVSLT